MTCPRWPVAFFFFTFSPRADLTADTTQARDGRRGSQIQPRATVACGNGQDLQESHIHDSSSSTFSPPCQCRGLLQPSVLSLGPRTQPPYVHGSLGLMGKRWAKPEREEMAWDMGNPGEPGKTQLGSGSTCCRSWNPLGTLCFFCSTRVARFRRPWPWSIGCQGSKGIRRFHNPLLEACS